LRPSSKQTKNFEVSFLKLDSMEPIAVMRRTGRKPPPEASASAPPPAAARVGRPPAVTVQAIVEVAIDIGLETVTFKQIADRLGVAQATLYRHVHNRDELLRLAAFQIMLARRLPDGEHEHWTALAERYAESLFEVFVAEPQLSAELLKGRLGPHAELDILEQFITAMAAHGFAAEEAAALFHWVGMLTLGAAVGAVGLKASVQNGEPWNEQIDAVLAERDDSELRHTRALLGNLGEASMLIDWRIPLRTMLAGYAAARAHAPAAAIGR
jgi:AcrR family transcriptional regulator